MKVRKNDRGMHRQTAVGIRQPSFENVPSFDENMAKRTAKGIRKEIYRQALAKGNVSANVTQQNDGACQVQTVCIHTNSRPSSAAKCLCAHRTTNVTF